MIRTQGLTKTFRDRHRGSFDAIGDISIECPPGQVFGLLGPNGAGKTTLLRILSTALKPSRGTAEVMGHDVVREADRVRRSIGFISVSTGLYGKLTPRETLRTFGRLYDMGGASLDTRINSLAESMSFAEYLDRPCDKLSLGNRQKVNVARCVLHDPPVIILDEPTSGLDVLSSRAILKLIQDSRERGRTVLFSTHRMDEVDRLADRVAVVHKGRVCFQDSVAVLKEHYGRDMEEAFLSIIAAGDETE